MLNGGVDETIFWTTRLLNPLIPGFTGEGNQIKAAIEDDADYMDFVKLFFHPYINCGN